MEKTTLHLILSFIFKNEIPKYIPCSILQPTACKLIKQTSAEKHLLSKSIVHSLQSADKTHLFHKSIADISFSPPLKVNSSTFFFLSFSVKYACQSKFSQIKPHYTQLPYSRFQILVGRDNILTGLIQLTSGM